MLIERALPLQTGEVAAIRLQTGEELIGKVVEVNETTITLTKPIVLQMVLQGQQAGVSFAPFMVSVAEDDKFPFYLDKLLLKPMKASKELQTQYIKMTTGIVPATGM